LPDRHLENQIMTASQSHSLTKKLTVRYSTIDEEAIERCRVLTGQTTINKALIRVIHEYPELTGRVNWLEARLEEAEKETRSMKRCILNQVQASRRLDDLATSWTDEPET